MPKHDCTEHVKVILPPVIVYREEIADCAV